MEAYLLKLHEGCRLSSPGVKGTLDPSATKRIGAQLGSTYKVINSETGEQIAAYFCKTLQSGATPHSPDVKKPNKHELFVYKLLQHIGVGAEVHFVVPERRSASTQRCLYIASKGLPIKFVKDIKGDLDRPKVRESFIEIETLNFVLRLDDVLDNMGNAGIINDENSPLNDAPIIVDFM